MSDNERFFQYYGAQGSADAPQNEAVQNEAQQMNEQPMQSGSMDGQAMSNDQMNGQGFGGPSQFGQQSPFGQGPMPGAGPIPGPQSYYSNNAPKPPKTNKPKKAHPFLKKLGSAAAIAAVVGLAGGVVFTGTTYFGAKLTGQNYQAALKTLDQTAGEEQEQIGSTEVVTAAQSTGSTDVSAIADKVMPSVVQVTNVSVDIYRSWFGEMYPKQSGCLGTGFIIKDDDEAVYIATNHHIVSGADELTITFIDDTAVPAEIVGSDKRSDLAVVKVNKKDISSSTLSKIKTVTLGDSDSIKVGERSIVLGNSMGYGQSVTAGVISAVGREVQLKVDDETVITNSLIQTDAAINLGNSGGPLLDGSGKVIGVVNSKCVDTSVEGLGYAIPITSAKPILEHLMNGTEISEDERDSSTDGRADTSSGQSHGNPDQTAFIGIYGVDIDDERASSYNMPAGVYIAEIIPGGAADKAGLSKRDIITAVNGTEIGSMVELQNYLADYAPGDKVTVSVARYEANYVLTDVEVTLTEKVTGSGQRN